MVDLKQLEKHLSSIDLNIKKAVDFLDDIETNTDRSAKGDEERNKILTDILNELKTRGDE